MKSKSKTKTIVLTLPPETEAKIREAARAHGLTAQAFVIEVLAGRLKAKLNLPPIRVGNPQLLIERKTRDDGGAGSVV